jgi:hypothetical protein
MRYQVELWIRGQGRIAFIHDLVEAITHRRAKGEKISEERGLGPGAKAVETSGAWW